MALWASWIVAMISTLLRKRGAVHSALLTPCADRARDVVRHAFGSGPGGFGTIAQVPA
jgi:hypothetical protein